MSLPPKMLTRLFLSFSIFNISHFPPFPVAEDPRLPLILHFRLLFFISYPFSALYLAT